MGNVTVKTSGEIASFMIPAKTNIKSLKVHFNPKQLGEGDPSPENVREIVGWDGVEVNRSGKNIAHIVGYSAENSNFNNARSISNNYGTTINTTEFLLPDTELVVTQTQYPNTSSVTTYANGYIAILVDNLIWGKKYNVSFKIDNIINNPLNVELKDITLLNPYGTVFSSPTIINDNYIIFKNVTWRRYSNTAINRRNFEIRICGMSFTLSEFMVTPVDEDDFEYEPYQGNMYSKDWSSEVGTVYGGYVDLAKGELVATHVIFEKKWNEYSNNYAMTDVNRRSILFPYERRKIGATSALCNIAKPAHDLKNKIHFYIAPENNCIYMFLPKDLDEETLIQVASRIEEPIHYSLTPQQLLTFKGENNIWSDTNGQTEVKFWTH